MNSHGMVDTPYKECNECEIEEKKKVFEERRGGPEKKKKRKSCIL